MQEEQEQDLSQEDILASFREERLEQRKKKPAILIGVSIGIVMALGIGWATFGRYVSVYYSAANGGSLPVIRADSSVDGIKPATPGGMEVPNRDKLVYERLRQSNTELPVERLLPSAETPKTPAGPEEEQPLTAENEAESQDPIAALTAKIIDTDQNNPQSSALIYEEDGMPVEVVFKEIREKENIAERTEKKAVPVKTAEVKTKAPPVNAEAGKADDKPTSDADRKSYFMIQLVSTRSESAAESEWKRLSKKYKEIIGNQPYLISKTVVSNGTFYRLRVGRFDTREAASAVCDQLKTKKQECFVVK